MSSLLLIRAFVLNSFVFLLVITTQAQDDLLKELEQDESKKPEYVQATFKGTRIVNGHSVETRSAGELDFIISHRFGKLNSGGYNLWGLDEADIRLGFEYGITNRLGMGIGRSSFNKIYDGYLKYKILQQGLNGGSPVTITGFGSINLLTYDDSTYSTSDRLSYTSQILIARKFSPKLSLQLSPSFTHSNRVDQTVLNNDQLAIGVGGRYKLTRSLALNIEYYYRVNPADKTRYHNSLGIGFDIETGGHIFQLIFSNTQGTIERTFLNETLGEFFDGEIHFGFNISRVFQVKQY